MAERRRRKTDENEFRGDRATPAGAISRAMNIATQKEEDAAKLTTDEQEKQSARRLQDAGPHHFKVTADHKAVPTERPRTMSMIDPSEWNLEDSREPYALKDGTEALLRVLEVRKSTRPETDTEYYTVRFEVPSEPYSKDIADFIDLPSSRLDAKRLNAARQKMLNFTQCFGIDLSRPFDPTEDWVGCQGWCILSLSKSDQYGEQNRISKYLKAH